MQKNKKKNNKKNGNFGLVLGIIIVALIVGAICYFKFIKGNNEESYFDDAGIDDVLRNVG